MKYLITIISILVALQILLINQELNKINNLNTFIPVEFTPLDKTKKVIKGDVAKMIAMKAIENDLNPKYLVALAKCESSLNPNIQSKFMQSYGREQSFGLFQIHLKAHKDVTVKQALDPVFNTQWAIQKIKEGKAPRYWVHCHKIAKNV